MALLPDADAIITGGIDENLNDVATTEIFSATTSQWSLGPSLHVPGSYHAISVTPTGVVVVQSGFTGGSTPDSSTEVIDLFPTKTALSMAGGTAPYFYSMLSGPGFIRGSTYYARKTRTAHIQAIDARGAQATFDIVVY